MATYEEFAPELHPPPLRGPYGTAWAEEHGARLDELLADTKDGVKARFPDDAPTDALPRIAADRLIVRGPVETDDEFRARLKAALAAWQWAGTKKGLLDHGLAPLGLEDTGIKTNTEWGSVPDGDTVKWARFWLVIAETHPWDDDGTWGDPGTYESTGTWGSTATLEEIQQIRSIIRLWKPARDVCFAIVVSFGSSATISSASGPVVITYTMSDAAANIAWDGVE